MKNVHKQSIKQNMIWNTLGSFVYLGCQWLLTFVVVRLSSDLNNAGNLSLAISITNLFFNIACFNVRPYQVSDVKNRITDREYSAFRIITSLVSFFLCIIYTQMFGYSIYKSSCIIIFMVFKLGEAWVDLLHGFEQKKSRMDIGGKSLFIRGILSISSFTLLFKITSSINISIIGMAIVTIGYILTYDMYFVRGFADVKPYITVRRFKELTFEFLPLTLAGLMSTAGMTFPRQLLENYSGTEILGIYATVATPAVIVQVAATYVFNPLLTLFAIYNAENRKRDFGKLFLKTSVVLCVISLVALGGCKIFGKWGLTFLYGEQIGKYSYLLIPVMLFTALNGFVWFLWNILIVLRKLKELFVVNFLGLFVCILFMKGFIQKYGMNGVSYVLILYTFLLILMMLSVLYVNMKKCKSNNH